MRFEKKVAVVVGGGAGIAAATANIMAHEGARVVVVDRDEAAAQTIVDAITQAGAEAIMVQADALSGSDIDAAVKEILDTYGTIDILVNAVGGSDVIKSRDAKVEDFSIADWQSVMDFNVRPAFLACRAVLPVMKAKRKGKIVNVASTAAFGIAQSSAAYACAKAGLVGFTKKLALETARDGINVNGTAPGVTMSDRAKRLIDSGAVTAESLGLSQIPLGRAGLPEEQAAVICFLASQAADYVTGVTIPVSGGTFM